MAQIILVEQTFDPPLTDEEHNRRSALIDKCLQMRNARWMRSYLSADRRRMVCEFEAADAQSVRDSFRSADAPFERVWSAELFQRK
jgi:hypothetical protein